MPLSKFFRRRKPNEPAVIDLHSIHSTDSEEVDLNPKPQPGLPLPQRLYGLAFIPHWCIEAKNSNLTYHQLLCLRGEW